MSKLEGLFRKVLDESEKLRPGYIATLGRGVANEELNKIFHIYVNSTPLLFEVIYHVVNGTKRGISNQKYFDFIPGFRLISVDEYQGELKNFRKIYDGKVNDLDCCFPFALNLSSDYYFLKVDREGVSDMGIYKAYHDDEPDLIYRNSECFLLTLLKCYKENAYFIDSDGYLDYDFDKEGVIATQINPNIEYWQ